MKQFVPELIRWVTIILALAFVYGYAGRWVQTMAHSKGHRVIGLLGVTSCAMVVIVIAFARQYAYLFAPLAFAGLALWTNYCNWYTDKYPTSLSSSAPPADASISPLQLFRYLANPEKQEQSFFTRNFRTIALVACTTFAFGFGFTRVVHYIHEGDQRVAATIQASAKQSNQVVSKVVSDVKKQTEQVVKSAVDTLIQGQAAIVSVADSDRRENKKGREEISKNTSALSRLDKKVNKVGAIADRARDSPVLYVSPAKPTTPATFQIPASKVRTPSPVRYKNGKPISFDEDDANAEPVATIKYDENDDQP